MDGESKRRESRRRKTWHVRGLGTPRAKRQIEVLQREFDLFSFDDDSDLRQQDQYSPTDTMVSRHTAAVCDGYGPRLLSCLRPTLDALRQFSPFQNYPRQIVDFDGRIGSRSATSNICLLQSQRAHETLLSLPSPSPSSLPRQHIQAWLHPSLGQERDSARQLD